MQAIFWSWEPSAVAGHDVTRKDDLLVQLLACLFLNSSKVLKLCGHLESAKHFQHGRLLKHAVSMSNVLFPCVWDSTCILGR